MIYNIVVGPIEALVGWIFLFIVNTLPSIGVIGAICGVSVAINILALPLYNIAESIQEKERRINKKLEPRVKRIKKGFKGDEQFMMLSEYYRQNGYHPLYALRGSLSILIEIPFFIAAYSYLSSCDILKESSFWIFSNLGEADRVFTLTLGSIVIPINILPIIMTAINFVSGYIYTKGSTKRDKIQLYAMGLFFLILLYNSPSGLVIYWILNNIFSLFKTIVLKFFKHPGRILHTLISFGLLAVLYFCRENSRAKVIVLALCTLLFIFSPLILKFIKSRKYKFDIPVSAVSKKSYFSSVLAFGLSIALLCGFLLPSSAVASSPEEFSYIGTISNPTSIVWSTFSLYVGLFVFWPIVVYKMFGEKVRKGESLLLFSLLVVALLDTFVFKCDYGTLSTQFLLNDTAVLDSAPLSSIIGPVVGFFLATLLFLFADYYGKSALLALLALSIAIGELVIGVTKMNYIERKFNEYKVLRENVAVAEDGGGDEVDSGNIYSLSRNGKNVVVIFLDRAIGSFFPYAVDQIEELKQQYKGFTYYPNTVSLGDCTVLGVPSMMGGYEYSPELMNTRDGLLKDLHNEATILAPTLFSNAGYSVTVSNPSFPNYTWSGDLSAFANLENVEAVETGGKFLDRYYLEVDYTGLSNEEITKKTKTGAVNFSLLQILPQLLRSTFYFNCGDTSSGDVLTWLSDLYYLSDTTDFSSEGDTFTFIGNEATHNPGLLDSSLLLPYTGSDKFECEIPTDDLNAEKHYSVFCASLKHIGRWLDWLRENKCYDNTRIIIVSDHGYEINTGIRTSTIESFSPLLLFKDFNSNGDIVTDDTFMTNADAIFLETDGLDEITMVNPYTGNELIQHKESGVNVYKNQNSEWNAPALAERTQFTLDKKDAFHVEENALLEENWTPLLKWEEMNK